MEYCVIGNLRDWIHKYPFPGETWAREVTKQILSVLVELNFSQLAHRNIKPSVCPPTPYEPNSLIDFIPDKG